MATVRMSKALQNQILKNFKQQCATAYGDSSGSGDFVMDVHRSLHNPMFYTVIEEYQKYKTFVDDYKKQTGELTAKYSHRHTNEPGFPFSLSNSVFFVVNPERPDAENRTQIENWSMETYDRGTMEEREINLSENFIDGDELIELPITSITETKNRYGEEISGLPFYRPTREEKSWRLHDDFEHKQTGAVWPIVISSALDIQNIKTVAAGKFKIKKAVEDMEDYLQKLKTLKQFVDNWPGAENLVPDEYMQKHAAKTVRKKSTAEEIPKLPDELKSDVNAAILENKLVGDL